MPKKDQPVLIKDPETKKEASGSLVVPEDLYGAGGQLGLGTACGYVSGYALRTIGRFVAFSLGTCFIVLQSLQYMGYVDVNFRKFERDYVKFLDLDGDGQITVKDAQLALDKIKDVLIFNIPGGVGFSAGWVYGLGGSLKAVGGVGAAGMAMGVGARALAATGAATGGPALLVTAKKWFMPDPSPEDEYRDTIKDKAFQQLKDLQKNVDSSLNKRNLQQIEKAALLMKKRVIVQEMEKKTPPPPPPGSKPAASGKSWWKLW